MQKPVEGAKRKCSASFRPTSSAKSISATEGDDHDDEDDNGDDSRISAFTSHSTYEHHRKWFKDESR